MDANSQSTMDEVNEHWKARIVQDFDQMAGIIIELRELATRTSLPKFSEMVTRLHEVYCQMANTVSLRVVLNGVATELACTEVKHDDGRPG